jgi:hypothetical protein
MRSVLLLFSGSAFETNDTDQYKPTGIPAHFNLGATTESGLKDRNK